MTNPFLFGRILLDFKGKKKLTESIVGNLSAVTFTPEGSLWLGSDEFTHLERLTLEKPNHYKKHERFDLSKLIELPNSSEEEIDLEGLDYSEPYLWIVGSHSTKRKKPRKDDTSPNRLKKVVLEANRYLIARIPLDFGDPLAPSPAPHTGNLQAARLPMDKDGNVLIQALIQDEYLADFAGRKNLIPSKENGIDIEGLAVRGNRIFLGLRGPVLRGWAIVLELEVEDSEGNKLTLKPIGPDDRPYKKHFLNLNGLGVRDLCLQGDDLIVLAGPTMDIFGGMQLYRLKNVFDLTGDTLLGQSDRLQLLFDLPFDPKADKAEGIALCSWIKQEDSFLLVYDAPAKRRKVDLDKVYADVFAIAPPKEG